MCSSNANDEHNKCRAHADNDLDFYIHDLPVLADSFAEFAVCANLSCVEIL